jgi:hypothetical protein
MEPTQRAELIRRYREGPTVFREALSRVSEDALDRHPEGGWSPRQIAHHLADSETTSGIRLRRLLAEDHPEIQGYDEMEFARRLHYDRPIEPSLAVVDAVRVATADLLDCLTEAEWAREGTHAESGAYSVEAWLEIYAAHAHDHAAQVDEVLRLVREGAV